MTDYVIWTRGLRGPAISVLRKRGTLSIEERNVILSGPTPMAEAHEELSLTELALLYPPPRLPPDDPLAVPVKPAPVSPNPAAQEAVGR